MPGAKRSISKPSGTTCCQVASVAAAQGAAHAIRARHYVLSVEHDPQRGTSDACPARIRVLCATRLLACCLGPNFWWDEFFGQSRVG